MQQLERYVEEASARAAPFSAPPPAAAPQTSPQQTTAPQTSAAVEGTANAAAGGDTGVAPDVPSATTAVDPILSAVGSAAAATAVAGPGDGENAVGPTAADTGQGTAAAMAVKQEEGAVAAEAAGQLSAPEAAAAARAEGAMIHETTRILHRVSQLVQVRSIFLLTLSQPRTRSGVQGHCLHCVLVSQTNLPSAFSFSSKLGCSRSHMHTLHIYVSHI